MNDTYEPHDSPWDQPRGGSRRHGGPRRGPGGPGGGPGSGSRRGSWNDGPPPWVQGLIGLAQGSGYPEGGHGGPPFNPFGRGHGGHRGPKVRRGDVRAAILDVLAVEPMNGYQIIQQIAERSGGAWKPSPGSVYPTVAQLEDEGLVEAHEGEGRRLLQLSDEGQRYVEEHPDELAATWRPFEQPEDDGSHADLKPVIGQMMGAVWQIVVSGTPQQQAEAAEILSDTRRRLYGLLANGADEQGSDTGDTGRS